MKKLIVGGVLCAVLLGGVGMAPAAQAQSAEVTALLEQIKTLTTLLNQLKEKMAAARTELMSLKADLREGMTDEDIKKVQEILAADASIYPAGLKTGYFGPMTKAALERFQTKYELEVTGELDDATKAALETIMEDRKLTGIINHGTFMKLENKYKFENRLRAHCNNAGPGKAQMCDRIKAKYKLEIEVEDEDEDEDEDDEDEDTEEDDEDTDTEEDDEDDEDEDAV